MYDDSLEGSYKVPYISKNIEHIVKPKFNIRDRLIDWVDTHEKTTKGDLLINVSSSGVANGVITALVRCGILVEHYFDCHNCTFYTLDKTKVNTI